MYWLRTMSIPGCWLMSKSHGFFSFRGMSNRQYQKPTNNSIVAMIPKNLQWNFCTPSLVLGTFLGVSLASIPASLTPTAECLSFALLLHSRYSSSLPAPERNQFNTKRLKNKTKNALHPKKGGESMGANPIPVGMMPHKNIQKHCWLD